jgi:hypothetical protein
MWTGRLLLALIVAVAGSAALEDPAAARRRRGPTCAPARYLLSAPLITGQDVSLEGVITSGEAAIAIDWICEPVAPKQYVRTRSGTRVRAKWTSCEGLRGRVRFAGKIDDDCTRLRGTLRAKGIRRRVEARRSVCGDGVLDGAGGEECESPGSADCSPACRAIATAVIGAAGGRTASLDQRLTLDVPAGALTEDVAITIRRLAPEEIPEPLRDAGQGFAYELGPDGLRFAAPVTATARLGSAPFGPDGTLAADLGALVTVGSHGGVELLGDQTIVLDGESDATTASGTLTHFSTFYALNPSETKILAAVFVRKPRRNQEFRIGEPIFVDLTYQLVEGRAGDYGFTGSPNPATVYHDDRAALVPRNTVIRAFGEDRVQLGQVMNRNDRASGAGIALPVYACAALGRGAYQAMLTVENWLGLDNQQLSILARVPVVCSQGETCQDSGPASDSGMCLGRCSDLDDDCVPVGDTCQCRARCGSLRPGFFADTCTEGVCPSGQVCATDGDRCRCAPPRDLCGEDPASGMCGGLCPGGSSVCGRRHGFPDDECRCRPHCLTLPAEGGDDQAVCAEGICPPGQECSAGIICSCVEVTTTTASSSTTTTTTTTTTSTTTTTLIPCTLDESDRVCGGQCPPSPDGRIQLCRALPDATCACVPDVEVCGAQGPRAGICGGRCPGVGEICGPFSSNGCRCFRFETPCGVNRTADDPVGSCGGECPPGQACGDSPVPGEACRCLPEAGSTTSTSAVSTTTTTSTTSTTLPRDGCGMGELEGQPVCSGDCPSFQICVQLGTGDCACVSNAEFCQPVDGICGGLCPSSEETCVAVDTPFGLGCRCQHP